MVFVSGDTGICEVATSVNPHVHVVPTNRGMGESVVALLHPEAARQRIRDGVQAALQSDLSAHAQPVKLLIAASSCCAICLRWEVWLITA
eukprot:COSAG04_NODE_496_length_13410_cov_8.377733_2_plen_90_part_00